MKTVRKVNEFMPIRKPLGYYCDDSALRFHVLNVGEGLMVLLIFPNKKVMLFDCNVKEDNEEEIIEFLSGSIPFTYDVDLDEERQFIDVFVNSHRDEDHYRGLRKVNEKFPIKSIWDSGQTGASTQSVDYKYYMELRRRLKAKNNNNLKVIIPTNKPIASLNGVDIYCFAGKEGFIPEFENGTMIFEAATKIQHTNAIVLQIRYGGTSLLLTGDSDWKSWKEKIMPNFYDQVKSEILIASHHGSRSFFTNEENDTIDIAKNPDTTYIDSIKKISPDIVLIPCGNYEAYHHPNKEALKIYREHCRNGQVYTTNKYGHLSGFIDKQGNYTVVPACFFNQQTAAKNLRADISCTYEYNSHKNPVANESVLPIGGTLHFVLKTSGGIVEPIQDVRVIWEVSNGGILSDSAHQEIYFKGKDEETGLFSFSRSLSYHGTHLLRCQINNRRKGSITKIFKIVGI